MTTASTISEFLWPRPALFGCLAGVVVRDTRGCALNHAQRFNFYPATPIPSVLMTFVGDSHVIDQSDQMEQPWTGARMPRFRFAGPTLRSTATWNCGETYFIGCGFVPDALSAMTGLDLSAFTGRMVSAEQALPPPMLEACRTFFDSVQRQGVETSFSVLEDAVGPMWARARPAATTPPRSTAQWITSLVHRAALTGSGRSTRQIARRVKSWTGMGRRDLQRFNQIERLHWKTLEAPLTGDVDWAALAAASGFADQAHMIRRMKQHTGFTPEQLLGSIRYDEAFWYYRLLDRIGDQYLKGVKGPADRFSAEASANRRPVAK